MAMRGPWAAGRVNDEPLGASDNPNPGAGRPESGASGRTGGGKCARRGRFDALGLPLPLGRRPSRRSGPARYAPRAGASAEPPTNPPQRTPPHHPTTPPPLPQPPKPVIISTLEASRPLILTLIVATLSS